MNLTPASDPLRRALRVAMVLLAAAGPGVPALAAAFNVPAGRVAQIVAVFSFATVLLTAVRNQLEDNTKFPAVLKAVPATGENPVPEPDPIPSRPVRKTVKKKAAADKGVTDLGLILVVVLIVVVLLLVFGGPHYYR